MQVSLRLATEADLPIILAWRSQPSVYQGFVQQKAPLFWKSHVEWYSQRNSGWRSFIVCVTENWIERPVGVVNIGQLDHWNPEIGYTIGEVTLWGKGVATEAVRLGIEWLKEYAQTHPHIVGIHTTILDSNKGSIKVVKKLGFKQGMKARQGESYWQRSL